MDWGKGSLAGIEPAIGVAGCLLGCVLGQSGKVPKGGGAIVELKQKGSDGGKAVPWGKTWEGAP